MIIKEIIMIGKRIIDKKKKETKKIFFNGGLKKDAFRLYGKKKKQKRSPNRDE